MPSEVAGLGVLLELGAAEQQRLACSNDPRGQPLAELDRRAEPPPGVHATETRSAFHAVVQRDIHVLGREDLAHCVADHFDQRA